jgi:ADP-ribose pyrophosphatase
LDKYLIELPAGKLEIGEDPEECAIRELEEETGMVPGKITKLGAIATTPGFCTEILHIYMAENLKKGQLNREEGEFGMSLLKLNLDEVERKIINGEIFDGKTLAGILYYKLKLNH